MDPQQPKYWFAAKRYGWGWGLPLTWQGWMVLAGFLVINLAVLLLPHGLARYAFLVVPPASLVVLIAICLKKGKPPRWRWGDGEKGR